MLSAWRWQQVLLVFDAHGPLCTAHRPLPRRAVRRQRAAVDDRRRRPPRQPRRRRPPARRRSRSRRWSSSASAASSRCPLLVFSGFAIEPSLLDADHAWFALRGRRRHARRARVILVRRRPPAPRRPVRRARELDALHRRGARRRRPAPPRARASRRRVLVAAFVYQLSVVARVVLHLPRPRRSTSRSPPCSRSCPRCDGCRCCRSRSAGLGVREGLLVLFLHPLGVPTGQAIAAGLLWYGMTLAREPARRAARSRSGTATRRPDRRRRRHRDARQPERRGTSAVSTPAAADARAARRLRDGHVLYWWVEILAVLVFYVVYSAIRNTARRAIRRRTAFRHAREIISLEQRPRHQPRADDPGVGAALPPADHRRQLLLRLAALHRHRSASMIYLFRSWSDDYPLWRNTLADQRPRSRSSASRSSRSCRRACSTACTAPPLRLRRHPRQGPDVLVVQLGRGAARSPTSSRPCRACTARGRSWCAFALVPRLRHRWAKVLAALYPSPRSRDRDHRQPLLPRRGRRVRHPRHRLVPVGLVTRAGRGDRRTPDRTRLACPARDRPLRPRPRRPRRPRHLGRAALPHRRARRHGHLRRRRRSASGRCRCGSAPTTVTA